MNKYFWMAVTPDELELPIAVADSARELAKMLGLTISAISKNYHLSKSHYKYKVVKVERGSHESKNIPGTHQEAGCTD